MSNYIPKANWSEKDSLNSGELLKKVSATEIGAEFDEISTMSTTKAEKAGDSAQDFNANNVGVNDLTVAGDLSVTGGITGGPIKAYGVTPEITTNGTTVLSNTLNLKNITRNTAGKYTIEFDNAFADTNYTVIVTLNYDRATDDGAFFTPIVNTKTTTTFDVYTSYDIASNGTVFGDAKGLNILVLG